MNSRTMILGMLTTGVASAALATPVIPADSVSVAQNASHLVTVTYQLGDDQNREPAIVTVDFETNVTGTAAGPWVSIGERNFRNVQGFVNKAVEPGVRTITWNPSKSWPDQVISAGNFRAKVKAWAKTCPPDYMAVNLALPMINYYTGTNALPFDIGDDICRKDILLMRKIPAAGVEWRMGSPTGEKGREPSTACVGMETTHYVSLSDDFYMGVFPITQWQYLRIMGLDVTVLSNPLEPRTELSYNRIRYGADTTTGVTGSGKAWPKDKGVNEESMLYKLRKLSGIDSFDLPTSAQWEFACRAGTSSALYTGKELASASPNTNIEDVNLNDIAWYAFNTKAAGFPDRVGLKQPNAWGLYDMYGLVYEWCLDYARTSWNANETNPEGPEEGTERFQVGGVNNDVPARCRSAFRMNRAPSMSLGGYKLFGCRVKCAAVAP